MAEYELLRGASRGVGIGIFIGLFVLLFTNGNLHYWPIAVPVLVLIGSWALLIGRL